MISSSLFAQEKSKAVFKEPQQGYYQNTIQKSLKEAEVQKEKRQSFKVD